MKELKVSLLLRVSTKKQLKSKKKVTESGVRNISQEEDMDLQRIEAMKLIAEKEKDGWVFSGIEYIEGGVSAFKTHTTKRKEINRAYDDAKNKVYDILLVYKLDRFGRRSSESLVSAQKFERICEIWVVDKKMKFSSQGSRDEIMAFIDFWHAKQSSEDTKGRVTDAMLQLHELGLWTGGNPPFGYHQHPFLPNMLEKDELESKTVLMIYELYTLQGMGYSRIINYLNKPEILINHRPRETEFWSTATVGKILKNTVYKGFLSYGKTGGVEGEWGNYQERKHEDEWSISKRKWDEYVIVSDEMWSLAEQLRTTRKTGMKEKGILDKSHLPINHSSTLLFSGGVAVCGYCMGSLCSHHEVKKKISPVDQREIVYRYTYYKCLNRIQRGRAVCNGERSMYKQSTVEEVVITQLKEFMKKLSTSDIRNSIEKFKGNKNDSTASNILLKKKELQKFEKLKLNAEKMIDQILMGEENISFDIENLNDRLNNAKSEIKRINEEIHILDTNSKTEKNEKKEFIDMISIIDKWDINFEAADHFTKRRMLAEVIKTVTVMKDSVKIKMSVNWMDLYKASFPTEIINTIHDKKVHVI